MGPPRSRRVSNHKARPRPHTSRRASREALLRVRGRPPMPFLEPVTLRGTYARLKPLSPAHHDALVEAVRDGELFKLWYTAIPSPEGMAKEIERRLALQAAGSMLPFTVTDA